MRIIESRSIDNQAGLLGSKLITGTSVIEGAFQSFIVAEDTVVTKVYNSIGIDVTGRLGLTSITLKAGAFISMPKNDYFSSIKLTSGSVVAYFVSHGGMTITAQAYLNEFLARVGSSCLEAEDCVKNHLQQLINIGLLQKASLVMSPSMYEEDLVKSVVPQDASGDLSFTRASNGTRVNSAGLVEVCPWNLVEYSEDFTNAVWTASKYNATVTANDITAPNGTLTADKVVFTTDGYLYYATSNFSPLEIPKITFSIYSKTSTQSIIFGGASISGTDVYSFEDVGNGWYRQSLTRTFNTTSTGYLQILPFGSNVTKYFWGAQLNIGSTAKPYFPTTDRLNVPRLTYQNGGGGCPSLLLEKQSTNLVLYSEQFDNADWSKIGSTITANATISPDGTQNADKLIEDTSTGNHRIVNTAFAVNNGNAHSQSWYVKYFNNQWIQLNRGQEGSGYLNFDLINGVVGYTGGITDYQISNMANGWYRISINYVVTGTYATAGISILDTNVNARYESYVGDGTSGVYIWGCQYEQSSYPTSYIPTTSSSATRVADACFKTGISSLIGQTEGVMFIDAKNLYPSGARTIGLLFTSGSAFYQMYINSSNQVRIDVNGSFLFLGGTIAENTQYKIAFAYKSGSNALYINGTQIATSASTTIPSSLADFYVGNSLSSEQSGSINQAILFPTRLTNAELASLTTI